MPLHVHLLENLEPAVIESMRAQLSADVQLTTGLQVAPEAEVLVGSPTREQLAASSRLRAVVVPFTGIAPGLRAVMLDHPHLTLHNSRWPTIPTAEGALTLLLAATKFVLPADRAFRRHNWEMRYQPSPSILLAGKTVLVLGFGAIGQLIGRMCHALGMKVIGVRRNAGGRLDFPAEVYPVSELRAVLPRASILIVTLPLTEATKGLIGVEELRLLAKPAFLVNVGRGPVIDEAALFHALRDGTLAAAGLDVWYTYPKDASEHAHTPPSQYPFHELDNVVMSQHRIDLVREHDARLVAELAETLNLAARGEPLRYRVDVQAGY
jgi:phosphoglycerate dehydrogenase-like enzyme